MCRGGLCVPSVLDGADGGTLPAAYEPHRGCSTDADCRADELCTRFGEASYACRRPCEGHADCALGDTTSQCVDVVWGSGNVYACSVPCDPIGRDGCPVGEACDALEGVDPARNVTDVSECRPLADDRVQGEACSSGVPDLTLCAAGFSCNTYVTPPVCQQICATDGSGPACPAGTTCTREGWFVQLGGTVLGSCE